MVATGVMDVIFEMAATTATTATTVTTVTTATTGAKGPLPTVRTMTGPQAVGSLTVRPVRRTVIALSATTVMVRAGGLRVRRAMTGPAAMTGRAGQNARIGQNVKTALAVRTDRTETTVAARGVTLAVGGMVDKAAIPVVGLAGTETAVVRVAKTSVPARAAASPNRLWPV